MEMYAGPEQRATDIYMIPGTAPNPHLTYVPQFEEVDYAVNDMVPEIIYDQGLYYPTPNYYGYYSGFESPGEWDDHSSFFGADAQEPRYSGLQTENSSYVYYTPSYGYTQSPYNPYNPYIPGAAIGLDVPYVGTQQYVTNPSYQTPVSSAAYVPVVQPSTDVLNSTQSPSLVSTAAAMSGRHVNASAKYTSPVASINVAAKTQRSASGNPTPETSQASQSRAKSSEGLLANVPSNKQSLSQGTIPLGSTTHAAQVRNSSGSVQAPNHLSHGRASIMPNQLKIAAPSNDSFPQYGSNIRGWAAADKFRPRLQFYGDLSNPSGGTDASGEHNRGPRTSKSKWTPAVDGVIATKSGSSNAQQSIVISADQYNRDDFPVSYPDAKFFVIKSYSEDDVHKSIKYKVWSSTSNGNKRLDSAYQDAQRISVGQRRNCPIFLFFSVNASGQFCGVAEMIGPVEFDKDMDFWQQDKWTGSFPVKWHIIKDVPNTSFRHIILENNENKPVTNSRDTQEIPYLPGLNMLNIFKGTIVKTSILDDFMFYEERESIMQEEKARLLGRSYDASQFLSAVIPVNNGAIPDPLKAGDTNGILNKTLKANEKLLKGASSQPAKADGVPLPPNGTVERAPSTTGKPPNAAVNHQVTEADGRIPNVVIRSPLKAGGRAHGKTLNHAVDDPAKANGKSTNISVDQSSNMPNSSSTTHVQPPKADKNSSKLKDPKNIADKPATSDPKDANNTGDQRPSKSMDKDSSKLKDTMSIADEPPMSELKDKKNSSDQRPSKPKDGTSTSTKWIAHEPQKYVVKDTKKTSDHRPSKSRDSSSSVPKGPKATRKESAISGDQPLKLHGNDPKSTGSQHLIEDRNSSKPKDQVIRKLDSIIPNNDKEDPKPKYAIHAGGTDSHEVASEGESSSSGVTDTMSNPMNVVTIGSVPVSVNGLVESSSGVITVGTIPIESKYSLGGSGGSRPIQK